MGKLSFNLHNYEKIIFTIGEQRVELRFDRSRSSGKDMFRIMIEAPIEVKINRERIARIEELGKTDDIL